jgi:hypothetical protein
LATEDPRQEQCLVEPTLSQARGVQWNGDQQRIGRERVALGEETAEGDGDDPLAAVLEALDGHR